MIQHDMMMWDHGMPGPDGKVSPEQRREADVNIEFAGSSKFAHEAQKMAWFFRQSNDKYATDYPAAVGDRMSNTDSGSFQDLCPAISLRENERLVADGHRLESDVAPADRRPLDVHRQGFSAWPERRADDVERGRAVDRSDVLEVGSPLRTAMHAEHNWAGNYTYTAASVQTPETLEQLQELVRAVSKLRALGTRHSFNGIADSPGVLVSLARLDRIAEVDRAHGTVTIGGGVRYGELGESLHGAGFALPNMASLPHISVAGACATATHGSGETNGNLATAVVAMDVVTSSGDLVAVSRESHGDAFDGMVVRSARSV